SNFSKSAPWSSPVGNLPLELRALWCIAPRNPEPRGNVLSYLLNPSRDGCVPGASQRRITCRYARRKLLETLERAKGFEPSTPTLARLCSTPELRPRSRSGRGF